MFAYLCGENYVEYTNKNQPDYTRFSKHKKWAEFTKTNFCTEIEMITQKITVSAMERHSVRGMGCGYVGGNFKKELPFDTPAEDLGNTLLSAFDLQK